MPNDVYHGFHEFYVHCCQTGQSPAALLSGRQESARLPVDTAHDGDGEEAVFRLRLPLIAADIASFSRRDTRTFPMMEHLFSEGLARDLSEDTLLWIDSMGYSLDWLFFGQGAMLKMVTGRFPYSGRAAPLLWTAGKSASCAPWRRAGLARTGPGFTGGATCAARTCRLPWPLSPAPL